MKTSPSLSLPLSSICVCDSEQRNEDSFLSDAATESEAYFIPPGSSEDSLLTLPFASTVRVI